MFGSPRSANFDRVMGGGFGARISVGLLTGFYGDDRIELYLLRVIGLCFRK
jgi:hypothetical protein